MWISKQHCPGFELESQCLFLMVITIALWVLPHTHTHTHAYIYICVCVCVCIYIVCLVIKSLFKHVLLKIAVYFLFRIFKWRRLNLLIIFLVSWSRWWRKCPRLVQVLMTISLVILRCCVRLCNLNCFLDECNAQKRVKGMPPWQQENHLKSTS